MAAPPEEASIASTRPIEFVREWLEPYLAERLPGDGPIEVTEIERFTRGGSRETWSVYYRHGPAGNVKGLIFRIDMPSGSNQPSPLYEEFFMYDRLGHTPVPVAKALFWEDRPEWSAPGRPFYVREQIVGSWDIPNFHDRDPRYDELRIAISKEHLRKLALIHTVDWKAAGFNVLLPVPPDADHAAHLYVDRIRQAIEDVPGGDHMPIVLEAVEWFLDHAPPAPRLCLCKGTNGYGEEVFVGREIVAMSDWEESSIGDPASDIAICQFFIPEIEREGRTLWGLEQALEYYESVSGIHISVASVRFYQRVRGLNFILFGQRGGYGVETHRNADIRKAWAASETRYLGKHLVAATIGLMDPPPPERLNELHESVC